MRVILPFASDAVHLDLLRAQEIIPSASNHPVSGRKRRAGWSESDTPEAGPIRKRMKTEERSRVDGEDVDALEAELKAIRARARAIEEKLRASAESSAPSRVKRERDPSMEKLGDE